jgi:putative transposase
MTALVSELGEVVGVTRVCTALGVARPSYYRRSRPSPRRVAPRPPPPRALCPIEQPDVIEVLHSERFVDRAPAQVVAALLEEGIYHCSARTMYRLLGARGEVRERRNQLRHPRYQRPELLATGPNQVWSWDLTKLRAAQKWTYYYLYVLLDIFSRYAVGWMLAHRESGELAADLLEPSYHKHGVEPDQVTVHADRGSAPTSKTLTQMMIDLGIHRSHSRPRVRNDNPFPNRTFTRSNRDPTTPSASGATKMRRASAGAPSSGTTTSTTIRASRC